jgi:hypothetical protein
MPWACGTARALGLVGWVGGVTALLCVGGGGWYAVSTNLFDVYPLCECVSVCVCVLCF